MKRIYHPGGSVVTGSDLADAVLLYAEALSNRHETDVVDIPVIADDGSPGRAQFLIGRSSQLVSVTSADALLELTEASTITALRNKVRTGSVPASLAWAGAPAGSPQFDEFDY
jgi:selenocysteine lyase/cysteine desulfurase